MEDGRQAEGVTRPGAIGIGAQKCMTSWIHALASAHPDVAASEPKELDFFSNHFDRGYRWYERHFPCRPGTGAVGFECSPSYFHDPRAPERAAAYHPGLKVVVLLRDPVARAYSNHLHEIARGHIAPCGFAEGLANNPAYIEQGLYAMHLGRWLDRFPRARVLCLITEEIARDPQAAARRFYGFLGVDPGHRPGVVDERRNDSDRARSALLRRTLRAGGDALRRAGLEEALIHLKRAPGVAAALRLNSVALRDEVPPMAAADAARLAAVLAPEVERLAALLGRDSLPWPTWEMTAGAAPARAGGTR
jgi:Sulfotransferase domain